MSDLVKLRKYVATVEETHHDGGPVLARAVTKAVVGGVVANPYAGRHVADIQPMMKALEPLAVDLTERVMKLLGAKGSDLEAYGKASLWAWRASWSMRRCGTNPRGSASATLFSRLEVVVQSRSCPRR